MEERCILLTEACKRLGLAYITLWKWTKEGRVKVIRLPNGRLALPIEEFEKLKPQEFKIIERPRAVIYARVSGNTQKKRGDLDRQVEVLKNYALKKGYKIVDVITDVGSGLNPNRKGLKQLFKLVVQNRVDVVLITYKDRLTRFGFEYLEYFFKRFNVEIEEVLKEEKEPLEELVEDFLHLIISFAGRIYGRRSKKAREFIETNIKLLESTNVLVPEKFKL